MEFVDGLDGTCTINIDAVCSPNSVPLRLRYSSPHGQARPNISVQGNLGSGSGFEFLQRSLESILFGAVVHITAHIRPPSFAHWMHLLSDLFRGRHRK